MGLDVRCPACRAVFYAGGSGAPVDCPACGNRVADPAAAAAPAADSGAAAPSRVIPDLVRACPSCGERYPGSKLRCPGCGTGYAVAKAQKEAETRGETLPLEREAMRRGVLGGVVLLGIAAAWFFIGLAFDRVFIIHPAILAITGIGALVKGFATGNYGGENPPQRRGGRRR